MSNDTATINLDASESLRAMKTSLAGEKREIKGKKYDLQFDNLTEEDRLKAEAAIDEEYEQKKLEFQSAIEKTRENIAALNAEVAANNEALKAKIEEIKATETACTPEEKAEAKAKYATALRAENEKHAAFISERKAEILRIRTETKVATKALNAQFKEVRRTPMKRAEKADRLDLIKEDIYRTTGNADLQILALRKEIEAENERYKAVKAQLKNEMDLKITHVATLIKNERAATAEKNRPIKENRRTLQADLKPVGSVTEKVAIGSRQWGRRWLERQKESFTSWKGFSNWLVHNAVYLIIIAMVIVTAIIKPRWVNLASFVAIIKHTSALLPLALGVAGCIVLTGTDLSLGRIMGFTALIAATLLGFSSGDGGVIAKWTAEMPWIWILVVLVVVMAIGGAFGALNGFFVAHFSIHPFVVTLGTQLIVYGAILLYGSAVGVSVTFQGSAPIAQAYSNFITGGFRIGTVLVEWYNIYAILLLLITSFIWYKTKFGKAMFAVGCNPVAAEVSGINVKRTIIMTFVLAGIFYGIGGFQYNPINGGSQLSTGAGGELDPITAAVIGGVSFTGGIGKVSGVLLGCILLKVIDSCLLALGVPTAYINIAKGTIILVAVALDMKKYIAKK